MNNRQLPPNALKDTKVLVVDDEEILAWSIDTELKSLSAEVMRAGSVREALERFNMFGPDLVITDLRLPDGNGLELLKKWRIEHPDIPVILITAHGAIDSAVTALRLGAFDYLQKPFDMKDLIAAVRRASEMAKLRQKVSGMQGVEAKHTEVEMIGHSVEIATLREQLLRIARSKANTALILGDSGTGKELAARAIHSWSDRASLPFVEINCASIPETLLESELFGYERGAFTDARERKIGLFEIAKNGSIFLDEIGDMPLKLQAKLLRALEYRRFKRLGGVKDIEFTARIVAATHRNLRWEVHEQRFREDLYYRLNVLPVKIPRLAERLVDVPLLAEFFVHRLAEELGLARPGITRSALEKLMNYSWPGNIRELKNVLQRALVFFEPAVIGPEHIDLEIWTHEDPRSMVSELPGVTSPLPVAYSGGLPTPTPSPMPSSLQTEAPFPSSPVYQGAYQAALAHGSAPFAAVGGDGVRPGSSVPIGGAGSPSGFQQQSNFYQSHPHLLQDNHTSASAKPPTPPVVDNTPWSGLNDAGVLLPAQGLNLDDLEKSLMIQALYRSRHNQTKAASLLGISRHTLRYRLEKHGLLQGSSTAPASGQDLGETSKEDCGGGEPEASDEGEENKDVENSRAEANSA